MKKTILSALVLLISVASFAKDEIDNGYRWYLQGHFNGTYSANEDLRYNDFGDALSWGADLSLGYNINDLWGIDLQLAFNKNKSAVHVANIGDISNPAYQHVFSFNSWEPTLSLTYNLSNGFFGYMPGRRHNLYLNAGPALAIRSKIDVDSKYEMENPDSKAILGARVGFNYIYSINNTLAFTANVSGNLFGDKFNGIAWQEPLDGRLNVGVGLRVYLSKSTKPARETVYLDQINMIHDTITVTEQKIVNTQDVYPIFFSTNNAQLQQSQSGVVQSVAAALKENPTKVVYVLGYADKDTEAEANETLAKSRADVITSELINAGIDSARIITHDMGDNVQPFLKLSEKNRSTICIITDLKDE